MLDATDLALLSALQANGTATAQDLANQLHLSASQIGRRRQRLEADGYIEGYTARLHPGKLGLHVQTFIQVHMASHGTEISAAFARLVRTTPQIVSAWTMTGEADYLLRVFCADLQELNRLVQETLLPHPAVARVHSQIVMAQIKRDAPLPT